MFCEDGFQVIDIGLHDGEKIAVFGAIAGGVKDHAFDADGFEAIDGFGEGGVFPDHPLGGMGLENFFEGGPLFVVGRDIGFPEDGLDVEVVSAGEVIVNGVGGDEGEVVVLGGEFFEVVIEPVQVRSERIVIGFGGVGMDEAGLDERIGDRGRLLGSL